MMQIRSEISPTHQACLNWSLSVKQMVLNCICFYMNKNMNIHFGYLCISPSVIVIYVSLFVFLGNTVWELLVQEIWSSPVQWAHNNCKGHGFSPTESFTSVGESEAATGRQIASQLLAQNLQSAHLWY